MRLSDAPLGSRVTVAAHPAGHPAARALVAAGLWQGAQVDVLQRAAWGGRVVAVGADRMVLDGHACEALAVVAGSDAPL